MFVIRKWAEYNYFAHNELENFSELIDLLFYVFLDNTVKAAIFSNSDLTKITFEYESLKRTSIVYKLLF